MKIVKMLEMSYVTETPFSMIRFFFKGSFLKILFILMKE